MVSYDTPAFATKKAKWAQKVALGSAMWQEIIMDKSRSESSFDAVVKGCFGVGTVQLEKGVIHLGYPLNVNKNLRNRFQRGVVWIEEWVAKLRTWKCLHSCIFSSCMIVSVIQHLYLKTGLHRPYCARSSKSGGQLLTIFTALCFCFGSYIMIMNHSSRISTQIGFVHRI